MNELNKLLVMYIADVYFGRVTEKIQLPNLLFTSNTQLFKVLKFFVSCFDNWNYLAFLN